MRQADGQSTWVNVQNMSDSTIIVDATYSTTSRSYYNKKKASTCQNLVNGV